MTKYKKIVEFSAFQFNPEALANDSDQEIVQLISKAFEHAVTVHSVKRKRGQLWITISPNIGKTTYQLDAGEWLVEEDDFQYFSIHSGEDFLKMLGSQRH